MLVQEKLLTAEEFINLPRPDDHRNELVRGRLVRMPIRTMSHSIAAARIGGALHAFAEAQNHGAVGVSPHCKVDRNPDTVRQPDAGYFPEDQLPQVGPIQELFDLAPAISVEVKSKGQTERELMARVDQFHDCGARMVWVVRLKQRTVTIYRRGHAPEILTEEDDLDGGDVLPGFRYPLRRLFHRLK